MSLRARGRFDLDALPSGRLFHEPLRGRELATAAASGSDQTAPYQQHETRVHENANVPERVLLSQPIHRPQGSAARRLTASDLA
jgi:hypothetical protein